MVCAKQEWALKDNPLTPCEVLGSKLPLPCGWMLKAMSTRRSPKGRIQQTNQMMGGLLLLVAADWLQSVMLQSVALAEKQRAASEVNPKP